MNTFTLNHTGIVNNNSLEISIILINLSALNSLKVNKKIIKNHRKIVTLKLLSGLGLVLSTKIFSEFWQNSQNYENFLRFSKCVPIKIFWGKFSKICPASSTKIFCLKISQIVWKNLGVQNSQIFVRKILRTQIFVDRIKPWKHQENVIFQFNFNFNIYYLKVRIICRLGIHVHI